MSLEDKLAGHVYLFNSEGDAVIDRDVLLEVTDTDAGCVELHFDVASPKRSVYVKFRLSDLKALLRAKDGLP